MSFVFLDSMFRQSLIMHKLQLIMISLENFRAPRICMYTSTFALTKWEQRFTVPNGRKDIPVLINKLVLRWNLKANIYIWTYSEGYLWFKSFLIYSLLVWRIKYKQEELYQTREYELYNVYWLYYYFKEWSCWASTTESLKADHSALCVHRLE